MVFFMGCVSYDLEFGTLSGEQPSRVETVSAMVACGGEQRAEPHAARASTVSFVPPGVAASVMPGALSSVRAGCSESLRALVSPPSASVGRWRRGER